MVQNKDQIDLHEYTKGLIHGPGGFLAYESREVVAFQDRDYRIASFVIRALANIHSKDSEKALNAILKRREKTNSVFNHLLRDSLPDGKLEELGFKYEGEGDDPRSYDWNLRNDQFHIVIDPWYEVKLSRLDSDFITMKVSDLSDLEDLINFIQ